MKCTALLPEAPCLTDRLNKVLQSDEYGDGNCGARRPLCVDIASSRCMVKSSATLDAGYSFDVQLGHA